MAMPIGRFMDFGHSSVMKMAMPILIGTPITIAIRDEITVP